MEVVVRIPEGSLSYWAWVGRYENGDIPFYAKNINSLNDFIAFDITDCFLNSDEAFNMAYEYLEQNAAAIIEKHPEAATALADFIK